jgi:hypothetical protein
MKRKKKLWALRAPKLLTHLTRHPHRQLSPRRQHSAVSALQPPEGWDSLARPEGCLKEVGTVSIDKYPHKDQPLKQCCFPDPALFAGSGIFVPDLEPAIYNYLYFNKPVHF